MPKKTDRKKSPKLHENSAPIMGSNHVGNPFKQDVNLNFDQQFPRRLYPIPGPSREL